jgi:hypothetical protein
MGFFNRLFGHKKEPPENDNEGDQPHEPPSAQRVAARALALSVVLYRASLEQDPRNKDFQKFHARLPEWIDGLGLASELEPQEASLVRAPLGRADERAAINASWRGEGLAVLAWALGRFQLPVYDQMADPRQSTASVGFSEEKLATLDTGVARELLAGAQLAPPGVIGVFTSHITVVGWRLRQFRLSPGPLDYVGLLRAYPNFKQHWLEHARFIDGDLVIGDQAIADAPSDYVATCEGSADERRIAAYWLAGDHPLYSHVDPSTILSSA